MVPRSDQNITGAAAEADPDDVRVRWPALAISVAVAGALAAFDALVGAGTLPRVLFAASAAGAGVLVTAALTPTAVERARAVGADLVISTHRVAVLIAAAMWFGISTWCLDGEVALAVWLAAGPWVILAAAVDAQTGRLPISLTRSATLGALTTAVVAGMWTGAIAAAGLAIAAAALLYLLYVLLALASRGGIGMGDVRLLTALTIPLVMYDVAAWATGLILSQLLIIATWCALRLSRGHADRRVIAGPAIVCGAVLALILVA